MGVDPVTGVERAALGSRRVWGEGNHLIVERLLEEELFRKSRVSCIGGRECESIAIPGPVGREKTHDKNLLGICGG